MLRITFREKDDMFSLEMLSLKGVELSPPTLSVNKIAHFNNNDSSPPAVAPQERNTEDQ